MKDVYSKSFAGIHEDDTLSHCLSLLEKDNRRVLVVLDNENEYKAVLVRRWIIRSMLDPSTTKVKTLMRSAPKVTLDDSLSKVARLMIESGVMQLPVFREEELLGCVTDENVIHGAVANGWGNTKVESIMTRKPFVVEKDEPLGSVFNLFREHGISHAPVVSNGRLVGIISTHDIIKHIYETMERTPKKGVAEKINALTIPVRKLMIKPVITVSANTRLKIADEKMHKSNVSSLVVVRKGRPQGIVTERDFLEPIAQIETTEPRLRVQFSAKDVEVDGMQREFLRGEFDSFARKFGETLSEGILFVYLKSHGTHYNGRQLIHCRFQLRSPKGSFFSSSEGWDVEQIFRLALHRLEIQILRSKETERHTELARTYLRRINFPSAEL
ncbi:MAG TPA: CBS domain-containing protein [Candidatus Bathyarchaeia archaeon]|nr:CBS domain-containing protein [Candidatus Bathyarchaeia archaeon]